VICGAMANATIIERLGQLPRNCIPRGKVRFLVERVPETGQNGCAEPRLLHHRPVAQTLQHLGTGSARSAARRPDLLRADVSVLGDEQ
jgi:hypothetical protein